MASDCPFSSLSQTDGFWLSLLKSFSNLWLMIVPSRVLLRRTWEGTIKTHNFEKDLRRDNQKPQVWAGLDKGQSEWCPCLITPSVFSNVYLPWMYLIKFVCIYWWCPCLIAPSVFSNVYLPWTYTWLSLFIYTWQSSMDIISIYKQT
jgi:hypothetical protein